MSIRNIGIFAHVDAGKTTLSEQLLVRAGRLRQAGSVDRGTAFTDSMEVEKRRGISVRAVCVSLQWKGTLIRLIDTPRPYRFFLGNRALYLGDRCGGDRDRRGAGRPAADGDPVCRPVRPGAAGAFLPQ